MQKPKWRFRLSNEKVVFLQTIISPDFIWISVNDEPIDSREISGFETIIPIEFYDKTFILTLQKKPVGGYNYTLKTQNGEKLVALDANPSVAVADYASKVAESSEEKQTTRVHWLLLGCLLGGCLGLVFALMAIAVYESNRSQKSKIVLYIILCVVTVTWDVLFVFFSVRVGLWLVPLFPY